MKVVWCSTGVMTVDFYTKPLQGAMFRNLRDNIMGVVSQPYPGPGKINGPEKEFGQEWLEDHGVHRSVLEFRIFVPNPREVPELGPEKH